MNNPNELSQLRTKKVLAKNKLLEKLLKQLRFGEDDSLISAFLGALIVNASVKHSQSMSGFIGNDQFQALSLIHISEPTRPY